MSFFELHNPATSSWRRVSASLALSAMLGLTFTATSTSGPSQAIAGDLEQTSEPQPSVLVEVFLSPKHRDAIGPIKDAFASHSVTRIRPQVFRLGHPPKNIAIGRDVPAPIAQLALDLAVRYNDGVEFLLPEFRYFPNHVVIGSSAFDETSQIPITATDLERLRNPSLTTDAFHTLYRRLTGEDKRNPTYLK